jgi:hypothetical protein
MFADIASGETDWADIFFLVALIIFAVEFVAAVARRAIPIALTPLGLAFVALGLLVL